jgi:spoIIIJ-associated protein
MREEIMNEKATLEIIAPTVEEALAQGLAQLGLPAEAVSMEVLDAGSKGLFGLGGRQVRVRLTVKSDEVSTPPPLASKPVRKPAPVSVKESRPEPKRPVPAPVSKGNGEPDELLNLTEETISKLLHLMKMQAQVSAHYEESDRDDRRTIHVDVRGDDLSILIGRRSETLNAFQYVASLMVGKEVQQWVQLVVDVEGYRSRRESQLRRMAHRMAEQALKTGRRQVLEPMSSSERRIIHLELREHPAVTTESVGEDPYRKVTIIPKDT